ncbi:MAG: hypothetical protein ACYTGX_16905, partial [Planctomycetota bacterium]
DRRDAAPDEICSIHHWTTRCPVCDHRPWPAGSRFSDGTLVPRFVKLGCSCRWDDELGESIVPPIVERWPLRPR